MTAAPNKTYIVVTRIYDTLRGFGLNVKNTADDYKMDAAFVRNGVDCFAVNRAGVRQPIIVGDSTLKFDPEFDGLRWISPAGKSTAYKCIKIEHDETFRAFFATLTGQNIGHDMLKIVSETAAALCVEYNMYLEFYAMEALKARNDRIAAADSKIAALEAEKAELCDRIEALCDSSSELIAKNAELITRNASLVMHHESLSDRNADLEAALAALKKMVVV